MNRLEGANCADLPGFVIDKYFNCHAANEPLKRQVALAICGRCAVREACRDQAMNGPSPQRGVVGGLVANQIRIARAWRSFEIGARDTAPNDPRPDWLLRPDAAETVEQGLVENDPDEPLIER